MEKSKKIKRIAIILAAVLILGAGALAVWLFAFQGTQLIKADGKYGFSNAEKIKAEPDAGFVIDGILDEAQYQNSNWLKLKNTEGGAGVEVAATSYFGDNGLYIVFDITESSRIYFNPNRPTYLNSCIEMYLASSSVASMSSNQLLEIDMLPNGDLSIRQRTAKDNWVNVASTDDMMAMLGATTKGGPVNSEECTGYSLELFMPWVYLDKLGMNIAGDQDFFYVNPVHITSYNYEGTESGTDRYWYSFATQLGGDGWNDVPQYFRLGAKGALGTVPVTLKTGANYTITGNDSVVTGMLTTVDIAPDAGYAISSILVNGQEYIHRVAYNKDGSITLQLRGQEGGLTVSATAEAVTEGKKNLSGSVQVHKLGGDTLEGVSVSYKGPGGEKPLAMESDGSFLLSDLEQGYYIITAEKKGYAPINRGIYLNRNVNTELVLEYQVFQTEVGYNWILDDQNDGVLNRFGGSGKILTVDSYNKFRIDGQFKYDTQLAEAGKGNNYKQQRAGIQIKFSNGKYWRVDLMLEDGVYKVQYATHSDGTLFTWKTVHTLTDEQIAKYCSQEGIQLSVLRDGNYAWVCLDGKPVAIEVLDSEYANLTAQLGFEGWVANQQIEELKYNISGTLDRNLRSFYFTTNTKWDISGQMDGVLRLPEGGSAAIPFYGKYTDVALTLKNIKEHDTTGQKPGRTDILLEFDTNGDGKADKSVSFGIVCTDRANKVCWVQTLGNADNYIPATRIKGLYKLSTTEAAKYLGGKGVELQVIRKGTEAYLFLDGEEIAIWDLTQNGSGVTAKTPVVVSVRHYDAEGDVTLNFDISNQVGDVKIDRIFKANDKWDLSRQYEGVVSLPGGGTDTSLQFFKQYQNIDLTLKARENDATGTKPGRTDVLFEFDLNNDGTMDKNVSFGIIQRSNGRCVIETLGWAEKYLPESRINELYELTYEQTQKYNITGIDFRVVRYGTMVYLYLDHEQVAVFDLTQNGSGVTANTKANMFLRHYDAVANQINIPFKVTDQVVKPAVVEQKKPVFKPNHKWDLSGQYEGMIALPGGGTNVAAFYEQFTDLDLTITAKENKAANAENGGRTDVLFEFENGKNVSFGILKWSDTSSCIVETLGNSTNYIPENRKNTLYTLTNSETDAYLADGVQLRLVRSGTDVYVIVAGRVVAVFDLTQNNSGVTADMKATVSLRHYDAVADRVVIPFTVIDQVNESEIQKLPKPVFKPNNAWDLSQENLGTQTVNGVEAIKGNASLPGGGTNAVAFYESFTDMDLTITAKENKASGAANGGRTDVLLEFENGKNVSFGILKWSDTSSCIVETLGNSTNHIPANRKNTLYTLTKDETNAYLTDGVQLRLVRTGTDVHVIVEGKIVAVFDLTQNGSGVTADMKATVSLRHYDAVTDRVDIPFTVSRGFAEVTITDNSTDGAMGMQNKRGFVGGQIVLTSKTPSKTLIGLKVDGVEVPLKADGTYSFVATKSSYTVEGIFASAIFESNYDAALWDISGQHDGYVTVIGGGGATDKPLQFAGTYQNVDLTLNARDYADSSTASRTEFGFEFDVDGDGKIDTAKGDQTVTFGVVYTDGYYCIQTRAGTLLNWKRPYELTQAEINQFIVDAKEIAAGNEDGLDFRIIRYGTTMYLFIENKQVAICDLTKCANSSGDKASGVKANTKMFVYLRHYDDKRTAGVDIPFSISTEVEPVEVSIVAGDKGTVTTNPVNYYVNNGRTAKYSDVHFMGETIILTAKPSADSKLTSLVVNGAEVTLSGSSYSFTATKPKYEVQANFKTQASVFASNYDAALWDVSGQHDGYVTVIGGGGATAQPLQFAGTYQNIDLTVNARDYADSSTASRTDVGFEFDVDGDGKIDTAKGDQTVTFGVVYTDGYYCIQTRAGTLLNWKRPYELTQAEINQYIVDAKEIAAGNEDGLDLRIIRYGTTMYLFIENKQVAICDLTKCANSSGDKASGVKASTKMFVYLRHYDDKRADGVQIPFSISTEVTPVTVSMTTDGQGTVTTNVVNYYVNNGRTSKYSDTHFMGEKIVLTARPAVNAAIAGLAVNGIEVTMNNDGTYSFTVSKKQYEIHATFEE
ncbi:MAG: hypothetical protein IKW10_04220 [Oscillospiraceae bacterium]|nr:hypothetical protein [Oscillospiraceae bacterium]